MPTEIKSEIPSEPAKSDVLADLKLAREKVKILKEHAMKFAGKEGHNPFLWLAQKGITRLETELAVENPPIGVIEEALKLQISDPVVSDLKF